MHRPTGQRDGPALVHSTDLQDGRVILNGRRGRGSTPTVRNPAIFLPRVGRITPQKITIFEGTVPVMLSDCVLAIVPENQRHVTMLRGRILDAFGYLEAFYAGTGAPHITLGRLADFLHMIAVRVEHNG